MRVKLCRSLWAAQVLLAGGLVIGMSSAHAQRAGGDKEQGQQQQTRRTPAMREAVYDKLSKAQTCAQMNDMACARKLLDEVRDMKSLNSYEIAQMWNFYAFIYFSQDNYGEAVKAYENVLKQTDIPVALETTTLYSLATLYVQQEQYQKGLDTLNRWFKVSEMPGPDPYYLEAQIYYQLNKYKEGLVPIKQAIDIAKQQGKEAKESWYQLLYVFYYQLNDTKNAINTLTILADNWPKKQWIVALAGMYGEQGDSNKQLALYEVANEAGWLSSSQELTNLAQMLLQANIPYKAAILLQNGLDKGKIDSSETNWRLLSQSWQLADEDAKALPALKKASSLAKDGELDYMLAQSYTNLARWDECVDSVRTGIERGGLKHTDQAHLLLGNCLAELKKYDQARQAFETAARDTKDDRAKKTAEQWLKYIDNEQERQKGLRASRRG